MQRCWYSTCPKNCIRNAPDQMNWRRQPADAQRAGGHMRRRTFCAAAAGAIAATTLPMERLFAAAEAAADVPALGPDRKQVILKASDIDDLRAAMRGEVLTAGQDG